MSLEPLPPLVVRRAQPSDLPGIAAVQAVSTEAAQWDVHDYLSYDVIVAVCGDDLAGFAVARRLAEAEARVAAIVRTADGSVTTRPME